jgi:hypothetical protein
VEYTLYDRGHLYPTDTNEQQGHRRVLGSLRDCGHARDYVERQWQMLQQDAPEDFVIATGVQSSARDFVKAAADKLGVKIRWEGGGVAEIGYAADGKCIVAVDTRYFRPTEVETLLGDASKARQQLAWVPRTALSELVAGIVREDLKAADDGELGTMRTSVDRMGGWKQRWRPHGAAAPPHQEHAHEPPPRFRHRRHRSGRRPQ